MILRQSLYQPALLDLAKELKPEMFSSELLGRAFGQLMQRYREGLEVSAAGLTDFSAEEMSHLAGVQHRQEGPVNEQALLDCVRIIQKEYQSGRVTTEDDLLALRNRLKERKGIKA